MKLELKHIARYLPYKLKFEHTDIEDDITAIVEMQTLSFDCIGFDNGCDYYIEPDLLEDYNPVIKPILRPLSDLYKEIEGVVHIVELAKIESGISDLGEYKIATRENSGALKYHEHDDEDYSYPVVFSFSLEHGFAVQNTYPVYSPTGACGTLAKNQLALWDYLFSHHFDVYGLIDKGLAININDLK